MPNIDIGPQKARLFDIVQRAAQMISNDLVGKVSFEIFDQDGVRASITKNPYVNLRISTGTNYEVTRLQKRCPVSFSIDSALEWLILHELLHISLNHFALADTFGIAQRSLAKARPLVNLPTDVFLLVPLALELQADHDALCVSLGAYGSKKGWNDLRKRCTAIAAMLVLIECEEAKFDLRERSHPKAATRIFQLLGHLTEMPLIEAQLNQDASFITTEYDLQAFAREVTIPCFFDAIQLAQTAGATSIVDDLGSPEDFFKDLEIAKLGDPSQYADLKTQGAREWAKLWPCNEALKPILGGHFTN